MIMTEIVIYSIILEEVLNFIFSETVLILKGDYKSLRVFVLLS